MSNSDTTASDMGKSLVKGPKGELFDGKTGEVIDSTDLGKGAKLALVEGSHVETELPLLDATNTTEAPSLNYTDGGFFPLESPGDHFIGYIVREIKVAGGQYGIDEPVIDETTGKQVMQEGKPLVRKVQLAWECYGTGYFMTKGGSRSTVQGNIKIVQHERLKGPLSRIVGSAQAVKITYTGQMADKTRKKDGTTRSGAHLFEVVGVRTVRTTQR